MTRKFNLIMVLSDEENKLLTTYREVNPEIKITPLIKKYLFQRIKKDLALVDNA